MPLLRSGAVDRTGRNRRNMRLDRIPALRAGQGFVRYYMITFGAVNQHISSSLLKMGIKMPGNKKVAPVQLDFCPRR